MTTVIPIKLAGKVKITPENKCSFCGKPTPIAVEGPNRVFICPACVDLCHQIIATEREHLARVAKS